MNSKKNCNKRCNNLCYDLCINDSFSYEGYCVKYISYKFLDLFNSVKFIFYALTSSIIIIMIIIMRRNVDVERLVLVD